MLTLSKVNAVIASEAKQTILEIASATTWPRNDGIVGLLRFARNDETMTSPRQNDSKDEFHAS